MSYPQYPGQPGQQPQYPGQQQYPQSGPFPAPQSGGFPAQQQQPGPYGAPPQSAPFAAQPYPQAPYPAQPYGLQPKPSGGTAITSGVLAVLGGLFYGIGTVTLISQMIKYDVWHWTFLLSTAFDVIIMLTLLPGAILLFMRKPIGRMLTIVGCATAILALVVNIILSAAGLGFLGTALGGGLLAGGAIIGILFVVVPASATMVLAIVKPTARWCGIGEPAGQFPGQQQYPGGYAPQPGGRPPGY
ncbi:MAG TPA: hypothetical protein VJX66_16745 [Amycolatopsis sp.]|nr:hypothetical protein [Amycolatopsis sp.]